MPNETKEYLVIGSNNFWYDTCGTLKEAKAEAKTILKYKNKYDEGNPNYGDEESGHNPFTPNTIYIYEAKEIIRIDNK